MIQGLLANALRQLAQHNGYGGDILGAMLALLSLAAMVFLAWCALYYFIGVVKWMWVHAL